MAFDLIRFYCGNIAKHGNFKKGIFCSFTLITSLCIWYLIVDTYLVVLGRILRSPLQTTSPPIYNDSYNDNIIILYNHDILINESVFKHNHQADKISYCDNEFNILYLIQGSSIFDGPKWYHLLYKLHSNYLIYLYYDYEKYERDLNKLNTLLNVTNKHGLILKLVII
eukprot:518366_1